MESIPFVKAHFDEADTSDVTNACLVQSGILSNKKWKSYWFVVNDALREHCYEDWTSALIREPWKPIIKYCKLWISMFTNIDRQSATSSNGKFQTEQIVSDVVLTKWKDRERFASGAWSNF